MGKERRRDTSTKQAQEKQTERVEEQSVEKFRREQLHRNIRWLARYSALSKRLVFMRHI